MKSQWRAVNFIEDRERWTESSCSCDTFQTDYICKHVLMLAVRYGYIEVPTTAKNLPLGALPRRGRPAAVARALTREPAPVPASTQTPTPARAKLAPPTRKAGRPRAKPTASLESTPAPGQVAPIVSPRKPGRPPKRQASAIASPASPPPPAKKRQLIKTTSKPAGKRSKK